MDDVQLMVDFLSLTFPATEGKSEAQISQRNPTPAPEQRPHTPRSKATWDDHDPRTACSSTMAVMALDKLAAATHPVFARNTTVNVRHHDSHCLLCCTGCFVATLQCCRPSLLLRQKSCYCSHQRQTITNAVECYLTPTCRGRRLAHPLLF